MGLSEGCNLANRPLDPPLDAAAQLEWPHTLGYLFLRLEGTLDTAADPATPNFIHMGAAADPEGYAPQFELTLPKAGTPTTLPLKLSFDAILSAAGTETDLSNFSLPAFPSPVTAAELLAGERLRRAAVTSGIFSISAAP